jgi:hypothetical protein
MKQVYQEIGADGQVNMEVVLEKEGNLTDGTSDSRTVDASEKDSDVQDKGASDKDGDVQNESASEANGILQDEGASEVNMILQTMNASKVAKICENDIYTVYGYSREEDSCMLQNGEKVNVQIVMYYDEEADQTYIKVGIPMVNSGY